MKKSFGQHLLADSNYLKKIINEINLSSNDSVIEIGAGTGMLTLELAKIAKKVFAVEIERKIIQELKANLKSLNINNVELIISDFLKLDLNSLIKEPFIVVGNIPYNITSKILLKLFGEIDKPSSYLKNISSVNLMVQKEVAERLVAKCGSKAYSPLSVLVQYFSEPKIAFIVPSSAFYPIPKVDSAFVLFRIKQKRRELKNPAFLKKVIRTAFQQRRKKVLNALIPLCRDKNSLEQVFNKLNLNHNLRAENLSLEHYILLADELSD